MITIIVYNVEHCNYDLGFKEPHFYFLFRVVRSTELYICLSPVSVPMPSYLLLMRSYSDDRRLLIKWLPSLRAEKVFIFINLDVIYEIPNTLSAG